MLGIYVGFIGLILGSFLNVCIFRIPREESISFPPSHCMKCDTRIKIYDLFPVLSYLLLRGKCRKCGDKISIRYPIIELATGLIFFLLYLKFGFTLELVKFGVLTCFLIVIGMIDFDTTDVYTMTIIPAAVVGVVFVGIAFLNHEEILTYLYGGLVGGGFMGSIILLTRGKGMGRGDLDICLMCGIFLGLKNSMLMLFLAFVIGGVFSIYVLAAKKKKRKDAIPFGPFIVIATFISIFIGDQIINWYFSTMS